MLSAATEPFRRHPLAADAVLAFALFGLALALNDVGFDQGPPAPWMTPPAYWLAVVLLALTLLPLSFRRLAPLVAMLLGVTGLGLTRVLYVPEYTLSSIALFFYIYSAGRWGSERLRTPLRWVAVTVVLGVLAWAVYEERQFRTLGLISTRSYVLASVVGILGNLVFLIGPWVLGNVTRARAQRERDLAAANRALVVSRAEAERRAVTDERVRIARELHDVVAHHVSVMGVQAAAARRTIQSSPAAATEALADVEESSRQAVSELYRLLGFLRSPFSEGSGGSAVDLPAPTLEQLPALQRQTAAAGLAVSLSTTGERPSNLPKSVDLSAYRIVQEALTNALKHSGAHEAEVTVSYEADAVGLVVRDRGRGPTGEPSAGGNGLVGMHERVALHGGQFSAGPADGGGFVVEAHLPFDHAPTGMTTTAVRA